MLRIFLTLVMLQEALIFETFIQVPDHLADCWVITVMWEPHVNPKQIPQNLGTVLILPPNTEVTENKRRHTNHTKPIVLTTGSPSGIISKANALSKLTPRWRSFLVSGFPPFDWHRQQINNVTWYRQNCKDSSKLKHYHQGDHLKNGRWFVIDFNTWVCPKTCNL